MPRFEDIPQFTRHASYRIDVAWDYIEEQLNHASEGVVGGVDLDPDFQRAHVWTVSQQSRYVEFILKGGMTGRDIYWNCRGFRSGTRQGPYVLVDGKQRLQAVRLFLRDEITAFGYRRSEYSDKLDMLQCRFSWWVNDLKTREEVLTWYLDLNSGGTQHTDVELAKVQSLLLAEKEKKAAKKAKKP